MAAVVQNSIPGKVTTEEETIVSLTLPGWIMVISVCVVVPAGLIGNA